jgi:glycine cleavage system H protein
MAAGEKMYPSDLRYTKEHEWVRLQGGVATVGITDYAQKELGDVVYVEMPKVGAKLIAGKSMGTVESVKAVSDIFSPVAGEVTEINAALNQTPETINNDPHGQGWLIKMKVDDPGAVLSLLDAAAYESFISEQKDAAH